MRTLGDLKDLFTHHRKEAAGVIAAIALLFLAVRHKQKTDTAIQSGHPPLPLAAGSAANLLAAERRDVEMVDGPPGPAGAAGKTGATGKAGKTGKTGATGAAGGSGGGTTAAQAVQDTIDQADELAGKAQKEILSKNPSDPDVLQAQQDLYIGTGDYRAKAVSELAAGQVTEAATDAHTWLTMAQQAEKLVEDAGARGGSAIRATASGVSPAKAMLRGSDAGPGADPGPYDSSALTQTSYPDPTTPSPSTQTAPLNSGPLRIPTSAGATASAEVLASQPPSESEAPGAGGAAASTAFPAKTTATRSPSQPPDD